VRRAHLSSVANEQSLYSTEAGGRGLQSKTEAYERRLRNMAKKQVAVKEAEVEVVLQGSKIAQVAELYNPDGEYRLEVKDIAELMGISERSVWGYIWRAKNPEQYKKLLERYYSNKAAKKAAAEKKAKAIEGKNQ
jgi:hypothetical protein